MMLCASVLTPASSLADEASGTWTGQLELRGNYYWEQSTRVISPSLDFGMVSPGGVSVHGDYLVDSITSASQAAGVLEDIRFTEIRHAGTIGVGYEFDLGEMQLRLDGSAHVSREPDYLSLGGGIAAALSLNQRATVIRASAYYLHDQIRQRFRVGGGIRPDPEGGMSSDIFAENFNGVALSLGWEQVLTPSLYFQLTYQYGYLNGFLSNAYRRVAVADVLRPENHPGLRHRHTLTGHIAYHLRASRTSFHLLARAYADNWDIRALTPEIRVSQEIGTWLNVRLRWRHYTQTRAFFYSDAYETDLAEDANVTADPKMSQFHSNLIGIRTMVEFEFLEDTVLSLFERASLDLQFEYIFNTNRFGNGVIAQAGLVVPF